MAMHRTRLSLFYLVGYLSVTGLALMGAPALTLRVLQTNRDYGEVMPRFAGVLMVALAALVSQIVRHRLEVLYPATVVIRGGILAFVIGLYMASADPLFLMVAGVVGLGVLMTAIAYWRERPPAA